MILEEGNFPHPRCPYCDMFGSWEVFNQHHSDTSLCAQRGAERKRSQLVGQEAREGYVIYFKSYSHPLVMESSLCYLCRTLSEVENDWPSVVVNLCKARKMWACLSRILGREGEDPRILGRQLYLVQRPFG